MKKPLKSFDEVAATIRDAPGASEFYQDCGPLSLWVCAEYENIVLNVNGQREHQGNPPLLRGYSTNWGWFTEAAPSDEHWFSRLSAWRFAQQLAELAKEADLRLGSESDVAYAPFVTRWNGPERLALDTLKPVLGLNEDELLEFDNVDDEEIEGAELLAYSLFFGSDALLEGVEEYFGAVEIGAARRIAFLMHEELRDVQRIRFDLYERTGRYVVSPDYCIGLTASREHLVGLWSYEVRT
jgi:hypothetical protein